MLTLKLKHAVTFTIFALLVACVGSGDSKDNAANSMSAEVALNNGRKVSALAQNALVSQLGQAIEEGGTAHAVQFCNLQALGIVDSINQANNCTVQRLTTRRRNPANKVETRTERIAWNHFKTMAAGQPRDTVLMEGATPVYFKPIFIVADLCLQCHGSRSTQIELQTLETIDSLYPADAAVNYVMKDLRGMWKVSFE